MERSVEENIINANSPKGDAETEDTTSAMMLAASPSDHSGKHTGAEVETKNEVTNDNHDATVKKDPLESELSSDILLRDIECRIEVVNVDRQLPSLPDFDSYASSSSESEMVVTDDDVYLTRVRIPKHILNKDSSSARHKRPKTTPGIDDIPLSRLVGKRGPTGPLRIGKDGKLKRPVGRPRKNPVVVNLSLIHI